MKKVIALSCLLLTTGCFKAPSTSSRITAAGATFPAKIYQRWFLDYAANDGDQVNYQAIGSGSGRKAFIDQTVDFAATDDPIKQEDIKKVKRGVVQIPMIGGTIAFAYNYPGCDLKLTQEQAVRVAMSQITDWKELNCPSKPIAWIHRSDGSGTTKAFTNSMKAFSDTWTLGIGKSVKWKGGIGAKGNSGVASVMKTQVGSIGYLNKSYVTDQLQSAALQNLNGEFIKPTSESGAITLNNIKLDENLAGINPNPTAPGAYPISTLTWILAYKTGNMDNTYSLRKIFNYMLSDQAQYIAPTLGFSPLKGNILAKSRETVTQIEQ